MVCRDELWCCITPKNPPSAAPVIDELTRKLKTLSVLGEKRGSFSGWSKCGCGAAVMNIIVEMKDGRRLHPLAMHFLAYHRAEVPAALIEEIHRMKVDSHLIPDRVLDLAMPGTSEWIGLI